MDNLIGQPEHSQQLEQEQEEQHSWEKEFDDEIIARTIFVDLSCFIDKSFAFKVRYNQAKLFLIYTVTFISVIIVFL